MFYAKVSTKNTYAEPPGGLGVGGLWQVTFLFSGYQVLQIGSPGVCWDVLCQVPLVKDMALNRKSRWWVSFIIRIVMVDISKLKFMVGLYRNIICLSR